MTVLGLIAALALLAPVAEPSAPAGRPAGARLATTGGGLLVLEAVDVQYRFKKREMAASSRGAPVVLTRDDARLSCKEIVVRTDASNRVATANCTGDVRLVRGVRVLTCDRAIFDGASDRVTCEGNPVLRDAGSEARGTKLVYDLKEDEVRFEGEPGKPVQVTVPNDEVEQRKTELQERRRAKGAGERKP
ncbi:MAG: LptA/OstA family protein [Anaeromyxobacter sp.]